MDLKKLTGLFQGQNIIAVIDMLYGDGGKGKFVDLLAEQADIIARGTGGANAGHTIVHNGQTLIQHLVPSGILWDNNGRRLNIMGNGMVIDPVILCAELDTLIEAGLSFKGLRIAWNATLVLPTDLLMDRARETRPSSVGTTGRGIGSAYADRTARIGLVMNDLLNPSVFREKLLRNLEEKFIYLRSRDLAQVRETMQHADLQSGLFYDPVHIININAIVDFYMKLGKRLRKMIVDTDTLMQRAATAGKKILLEGAQGVWLGIDSGCLPFVTSSDPSIAGLAKGVGLMCSQVTLVLGIVKAPYMTRVGNGPFPTELGGTDAAIWCAKKTTTKKRERQLCRSFTVNDPIPYHQGIAIRRVGHEYGATTGRARRCGWLDLPTLRHAAKFGCRHLVFTKVDVLDLVKKIKICVGYEYFGPDYIHGSKTYRRGDKLEIAIPDRMIMEHCRPIYKVFKGWCKRTRRIRRYTSLPKELRVILEFICNETGCDMKAVSVGPEREETILI